MAPSRPPAAVRGAWRVGWPELEKSYDSVGAVRGVSLDIRSGEFLTLLGPSGSGKTTTLMMIAGFEMPTRRRHRDRRQSVVGAAAAQAQHRHGVPELRAVPASDGGGEHRLSAEAARRRSSRRARGWWRRRWSWCDLPGYGARYPRQLSGGQQQRVALARAIVFQPRLLLMDEPLGALDKQLRESLQLEMRRLHADLGITFIYVTHDQEEALTMSDRIAVMNEGSIAQVGTPEDLYDRPCDRFVASFHRRIEFPARRRARRGGRHGGCRVRRRHGARRVRRSGRRLGRSVTLTTRPERMRFADAPQCATRAEPHARHGDRGGVCRRALPLPAARRRTAPPIVLKEPSSAAIRRRVVGESAEIAWSVADTVVV